MKLFSAKTWAKFCVCAIPGKLIMYIWWSKSVFLAAKQTSLDNGLVHIDFEFFRNLTRLVTQPPSNVWRGRDSLPRTPSLLSYRVLTLTPWLASSLDSAFGDHTLTQSLSSMGCHNTLLSRESLHCRYITENEKDCQRVSMGRCMIRSDSRGRG